jgi:hypothetical protein
LTAGEGNDVTVLGVFMGLSELDRNSALAPESLQCIEEAIAGSEETVVSHLLDPVAGNDVRALRAVLKVSQAVLGTHRFDDALEVIAEQTLAALDAASFS